MKTSFGAGSHFRYSTQHSVYISQSIRDHMKGNDVGFWGWRLNEHRPAVGDLVCWAREAGVDFDHQKSGNYAGHCDIVVEVTEDEIFVIGGNVGDWSPVVRSPCTVVFSPDGNPAGERCSAIMQNRVSALGAVA